MDKADGFGVQDLSLYAFYFGASVDLIPHQRMSYMLHVHSYLMSPTGLEFTGNISPVPKLLQQLIMSYGVLSARLYAHQLTVFIIPAYGSIYAAFRVFEHAFCESMINTPAAVFLQLFGYRGMTLIIFANYEKSRGITVYTMYDTGS